MTLEDQQLAAPHSQLTMQAGWGKQNQNFINHKSLFMRKINASRP